MCKEKTRSLHFTILKNIFQITSSHVYCIKKLPKLLIQIKNIQAHKKRSGVDTQVYLVGSGIASLAAATYLEKDAGVSGENIHILEKDNIAGGALDGLGDEENGFVVRGGRMHDNTFLKYMEDFSGNTDGTGGLITITDSNWLMSIVIARQPHFPNQPENVKIFWGYGLYPDRKGNYIKKPMSECTGEEIMEELYYHLKIQEIMKPITEAGKVNCIPVALPFIDSLFMPRKIGDRPNVLPEGSTNFAFLGQFAEAPKDCVFTVEYSVRTAQMAVYGLFNTPKEVHPMHDSAHKPEYLITAIKAIGR